MAGARRHEIKEATKYQEKSYSVSIKFKLNSAVNKSVVIVNFHNMATRRQIKQVPLRSSSTT